MNTIELYYLSLLTGNNIKILFLTTSITTIAGVIPLALSDLARFPLASAIGFGLVASNLIALLVIPLT